MNRVAVLTAASVVASLSLATPAHAQLRGFIKKKVAEKAVEKVAGSKADSTLPVSTSSKREARYTPAILGEELTEDVLDAAIRGMQAEVASTARADSIDREIDVLRKQRAAVDEQQTYHADIDRYRQCVGAFLGQMEGNLLREVSIRAHRSAATDAEMKKWEDGYVAYTTELTGMLQRGDSAGASKLRRDFWHSIGRDIDTRADTLAAEKAGCGAAPTKSKGILAEERMDSLLNVSRQTREQYHASGAKASGLAAHRYDLALERIRTWWDDMRERASAGDRPASRETREHVAASVRFWNERENKLLQSRRDRLTPLMWKLYGLRDS